MRLKYVFIEKYRSLDKFKIRFDIDNSVEVIVGRNGCGKSNFIEALLEIFRHIYSFSSSESYNIFDYQIIYEIGGQEVDIKFEKTILSVNQTVQTSFKNINLPDHVLIYYSGHNVRVDNFIKNYDDNFSSYITRGDVKDSRRFIGADDSYKELLLSVLLLQPVENHTRAFLLNKLSINSVDDEFKLILKRPRYAINQYGKRKAAFDIESNDVADRYWKAEGDTKIFLDELSTCITKAKGEIVRSEGYLWNEDRYQLYINIDKFRDKFKRLNAEQLFKQFDNLKILNMLESITVPLILENKRESDISELSDGQLQSVYIYAISELFKESNCLTLMDEPDSFLHPEWQFDFLKQIDEISDDAKQTNHILLSSHSAVTLLPHKSKKVQYFDLKNGQPFCFPLPKHVAVQKLSSKLISYSEHDELLTIVRNIKEESKPVLFTEGNSDPLIINEAWRKLYQEEMPFIPYYAFTCTYINQLITDKRIHNEMGGKPVFALFDFDKAYNQWFSLNGQILEEDPDKGLIKKWSSGKSYAIMLPVPENEVIRSLVIKDEKSKTTWEDKSTCAIEHLFYGLDSTDKYFTEEEGKGKSKDITFTSDKDNFARNVVPTLPAEHFEVFRPMFEFIRLECNKQKITLEAY